MHHISSSLPVKGSSHLSSHERLYCPVAFAPEKTLRPVHHTYGDCLVYLCHVIVMARVRDPRYAKGHRDGFVPLNNRYMRNIIGHRRWQSVKLLAIACELVECDRSYSAGERSMGYRLCSPYAEASWGLREVCEEKLVRRLRKWRKERHRAMWERIRSGKAGVPAAVCEHLYHNLKRVQIDRKISEALTLEAAVAVDLIRRGRWFFHVDNYGRIHANIANLKRTLRKFLSVDGQRLVNVDIANSQPLFIGLISLTFLRNRAADTKGRGRKGRGGEREEGICGARTDLARYLGLCQRGELYRHVDTESGLSLDYDTLKHRVLATLFDRDSHRNAIYRVLDRDFPTLMAFIRGVKRHDYRQLAHRAQRAESDFIFGQVVSRLLRERPNLFITTIHDSVMTTIGGEQYVREVMLAEFRKLGIEPTVRIEDGSVYRSREVGTQGGDVRLSPN